MTYALDANIIIRLLRNDTTVNKHFDIAVNGNIKIVFPPYVNYEMLRGFRYKQAEAKERHYKDMCFRFSVGAMTEKIWERAAYIYGDVRRAGFTVGDADILIAAFCLEHGCTLVTNNTKDFEHIDGLRLEDWSKE
jgi:tRNA(fMet)-specific endonuclease VapC